MIDHLSMILPDMGNRSIRLMPGTFEGTVPNSPRYSAGASGLGSHMSICEGPPRIHKMITEVLRAVDLATEALASRRSKSESDRPIEPRIPAFTKLRRSGCWRVLRNSGQPGRLIEGSSIHLAGSPFRGRHALNDEGQ